MKKKKITTKDLCIIGLLAAFVFVATEFLGIRIPTPTGTTMLKTANAICLMGALLFGPVIGGLSAGFGSAIFDLTMPEYAAMAWLTFVRFFIMAFVCGLIAKIHNPTGENKVVNFVASLAGAVSYYLMYIGHSVGVLVLAGSDFKAAVVTNIPKLITSGINAVFAVAIAMIFTPALRRALQKANLLDRR